jgi:hypothetical protein
MNVLDKDKLYDDDTSLDAGWRRSYFQFFKCGASGSSARTVTKLLRPTKCYNSRL